MKLTSKPIVFFGSGPVAADSLRLLAEDFNVVAIVTKPRPPHHRGDVPVLELAEQLNLPTYTVKNRAELDALIATDPFQVELGVLIDFGIIVSQNVIDYFPLGIINSHFSILPEWRGADPITFSILSGQETTGVSLMFLTAGMDEGPLIAYGVQPMDTFKEPVTTPVLTKRLINLSHGLLRHELPRVLGGEAKGGVPQDITKRAVSYSRKLTKEDGLLDWTKPAEILEREIRAFIEWPKSRATFKGIDVIVTKAHVLENIALPSSTEKLAAAGSLAIVNKQLAVSCGEGALAIDRLKPAGKQEMTSEAFIAGYKTQIGL